MTTTSSFIHPDFEQTDSSKGIFTKSVVVECECYQQYTGAHGTSHALAFLKIVAILMFFWPLKIMTRGESRNLKIHFH